MSKARGEREDTVDAYRRGYIEALAMVQEHIGKRLKALEDAHHGLRSNWLGGPSRRHDDIMQRARELKTLGDVIFDLSQESARQR